jgi:putative hemolysin
MSICSPCRRIMPGVRLARPIDAIEALTRINLDDLVCSFGWEGRPLLNGISRRIFRSAAETFARQVVAFDTAVGTHGLVSASRSTLKHYVTDVRVFDRHRIPGGAFLALSNHPGMSDTLSLFGALDRPDLMVIALPRPFLQALPHTSKQLSYFRGEQSSHATLVRKVGTHLRAGGAVLTFPAGRIEPDPDVHEGAAEALASWASSASVFVRLAPETPIVPVLVRGVIWSQAARHWLVRSTRAKADREKAAAAVQLLAHTVLRVRSVTARVQIGRPIYGRELASAKTEVVHRAVLGEMERLIRNPPQGDGEPLV